MLSLDIRDLQVQIRLDSVDDHDRDEYLRIVIAGTAWEARVDGSCLQLQSYWRDTSRSESAEVCWIEILRTPCNFGGTRYWFQCPECWRRCGVLYYDSELWKCRKCANLSYESQSEGSIDRLFRRKNVLHQKTLEKTGITFPVKSKPKHMHWKTFIKIFLAEHRIRKRLLAELGQFVEGSDAM